MQNFTTKTIREIAIALPASVPVFEEYKIDYCCGGGHKFDEACQFAGVAPEIVSQKINYILNEQNKSPKSQKTSEDLTELIDSIVETHHVFTRQAITRLTALMEKVFSKHGQHHPELSALKVEFTQLCEDLIPHMQKEETILFPFIKHLGMSAKHNLSTPHPPFGTVKNPVRMMMTEHDQDGQILKKMREITGDYVVPEDACPSFRALYFGLEELEKDLHRHIHLENNLLFPTAIEREQEVLFGF